MKRPLLRLCVTAALAIAALAFASSAFAQKYVILYKQNSVASDAAATVAQARGSVVATYPQIGVVIARSTSRQAACWEPPGDRPVAGWPAHRRQNLRRKPAEVVMGAKRPDFRRQQGRQDSNLQPPVLETGALPVELRP